MRRWVMRLSSLSLAVLGIVAVNSSANLCLWMLHQPKEPDMLKEMAD